MRSAPSSDSTLAYIENYDNVNVDKADPGWLVSSEKPQLLENMLPPGDSAGGVLEVGAGTGYHFPYVRPGYSKYVMTDGDDAMLGIASRKFQSEINAGRVQT